MTRRKPKFRRCKCGNLIVLAHGSAVCACCRLKRMGLWRDEPWEKRKTAHRLPNETKNEMPLVWKAPVKLV